MFLYVDCRALSCIIQFIRGLGITIYFVDLKATDDGNSVSR